MTGRWVWLPAKAVVAGRVMSYVVIGTLTWGIVTLCESDADGLFKIVATAAGLGYMSASSQLHKGDPPAPAGSIEIFGEEVSS